MSELECRVKRERECTANERGARSKEERAVMECLIKPATLANEERSEYGQ
jgi:hypothetical protein